MMYITELLLQIASTAAILVFGGVFIIVCSVIMDELNRRKTIR